MMLTFNYKSAFVGEKKTSIKMARNFCDWRFYELNCVKFNATYDTYSQRWDCLSSRYCRMCFKTNSRFALGFVVNAQHHEHNGCQELDVNGLTDVMTKQFRRGLFLQTIQEISERRASSSPSALAWMVFSLQRAHVFTALSQQHNSHARIHFNARFFPCVDHVYRCFSSMNCLPLLI